MADGSRLPIDENAAFVRRAVEIARRHGGEVEAELGHVAGDEDVAQLAAVGALTDPAEAAAFVERTGAACLAVSIGNVHGVYRRPPALDWARLEAIRERVGAARSSPTEPPGFRGGPAARGRLGIAKVNVDASSRAVPGGARRPARVGADRATRPRG